MLNENHRILVIDDTEGIHKDFRTILGVQEARNESLSDIKVALFGGNSSRSRYRRPEYQVDSAYQGREGLEMVRQAAKENKPYMMAFVDVRMPPGWDGIETIQKIWKEYPGLQIVLCTAYSDYSWQETIEALGVSDRLLILKKPFDKMEVQQLASSLYEKWTLLKELDQKVILRTAQISETRDIAVFCMAKLAESRDPETGEHLARIRSYCRILAEELGKSGPYSSRIDDNFVEDICRSSPLHDIGKVGIPDAVLLKPGRLTDDEFVIMRQHTAIGADALDEARTFLNSGSFLEMAAEIARHHHEWFDGSGYPDGIKGQDIPLSARIVAVADVFDALTSVRVYKAAFSTEKAKQIINDESGTHFDPELVKAFNACYNDFLDIYQMFHNSSPNQNLQVV